MVVPKLSNRGEGQGSAVSVLKIVAKQRNGIVVCLTFLTVYWVFQSQPVSFSNYAVVVSDQSSKTPIHQQNFQSTTTKTINIDDWRNLTRAKCEKVVKQIGTQYDKEAAKKIAQVSNFIYNSLDYPDPTTVSQDPPTPHKRYDNCQNAYFDLGTNIGDSIGYFIESALDICTPLWLQANKKVDRWNPWLPRPRLNVTSLTYHSQGSGFVTVSANPTFRFLNLVMARLKLLPENVCVYGMEGNPLFTERLQKLENMLQQTQPRLFQHLHIHTETVISNANGPTQLFLDQVSVEHNFWGSSLLQTLADVRNTAMQNQGNAIAANVTGINLSTLLKQTMAPFQSDTQPEKVKEGNLIIKMDVEGAEYGVIKEIAKSGVLCDYVAKGNAAVLLVEFHGKKVVHEEELSSIKPGIKKARATLEECGVQFADMLPGWS